MHVRDLCGVKMPFCVAAKYCENWGEKFHRERLLSQFLATEIAF